MEAKEIFEKDGFLEMLNYIFLEMVKEEKKRKKI